MAVIIGAGSSLTAPGLLVNGTGVVSINYTYPTTVERLWQLGSFSPYYNQTTRVHTLGITVYGKKPDGTAGTNSISVAPSTTCTDIDAIEMAFNPSSCSTAIVGFQDDYYASSYSYSKESIGYGQETWQFTSKTIMPVAYTGEIRMLRGICTAQALVGDEAMSVADCGVVEDTAASQDPISSTYYESESGSVSAGATSFGNAEIIRELVITSVGGSIGKDTTVDGKKGQVSCTLPLQPVYL